MIDFNIRKANINDFDSLVSLRIELLKYENSLNSNNKFSKDRIEISKELIKTYLSRNNSVFFIAEINAKSEKLKRNINKNIVGYIHGTKDESPGDLEGYIQGLFVLKEYRNQGIGKMLLKELIVWFEGLKHGLTTDINNKLSLNFYKKYGYKEIKRNNNNNNNNNNNSKKSDVVFMVSS